MKLKLNEFLAACQPDNAVRVRIWDEEKKDYSLDKLLAELEPTEQYVYSYIVDCIYTYLGRDDVEIVVLVRRN